MRLWTRSIFFKATTSLRCIAKRCRRLEEDAPCPQSHCFLRFTRDCASERQLWRSGSVVAVMPGDLPMEQDIFDLRPLAEDRKSTRLNSSHSQISYAVFCLKKKNFFRLARVHYL